MPGLAEKVKAAEAQLATLRREHETLAEKKPKKEARARGEGSVYQTSYRDRKTGEKMLTANYYIRYRLPNGKRVREALDTTSRDEASRILRKRLDDRDAGRPAGPRIDKTTLSEVLAGLLTDYRTNGRKSVKRVEDSVAHLEDFLGKNARARTVDEVRIGEYVAHRQGEKTANGTINRELTALKRAFRLAHLERAGVPRSTAMARVGHKTESVYRRYAITDAAMQREARRSSRATPRARRRRPGRSSRSPRRRRRGPGDEARGVAFGSS